MGTRCVYAESRVGKVPGVRAKRKHTPNRNDSQQSPRNQASISSKRSTNHAATSTDLTYPDPDHEENVNWSTDWDLDPSSVDFSEELASIHIPSHTTAQGLSASPGPIMTFSGAEEYSLPDIDPSLEEFFMTQPSIPTPTEQPSEAFSSPQLPSMMGLRPRDESDSQCCLECCQIISDLENFIMTELKAFKIILGIVRKTLERLNHLVHVQESSRDIRCIMLFITLMYQILDLSGAGLSTVADEADRQRKRSLSGVTSGLGFGDFSMDAQEQSAFRMQAILKEVQHANEILGRIRALAGAGTTSDANGTSGSGQGQARGDCFLDLDVRFHELVARFATAM
ncbi:Uu.00g118410.m01.CDS01 [Anthostomella pinea]|uniref:Uu.00g118410.m01.CDS01 n=1 Tax=Anthostomella pinea TaxID=933095 RepID=A0AAI8VB66_9PEZI|nr:Uu.00g118410.m01.CDS01 [Anthostomella pinea]